MQHSLIRYIIEHILFEDPSIKNTTIYKNSSYDDKRLIDRTVSDVRSSVINDEITGIESFNKIVVNNTFETNMNFRGCCSIADYSKHYSSNPYTKIFRNYFEESFKRTLESKILYYKEKLENVINSAEPEGKTYRYTYRDSGETIETTGVTYTDKYYNKLQKGYQLAFKEFKKDEELWKEVREFLLYEVDVEVERRIESFKNTFEKYGVEFSLFGERILPHGSEWFIDIKEVSEQDLDILSKEFDEYLNNTDEFKKIFDEICKQLDITTSDSQRLLRLKWFIGGFMSYQKFNYELLRFHHIYTKDSFDKEIKEIFLKLVPNFKRWEKQSFVKTETKEKMQNYMNRFSLGDLRVSFIRKVDPVKNLIFVNKYVGLGKALAKMQDEVLKEYPKVKKPYNLYCRVENKDYHGEKINELISKMLNKNDFDFNNMSCDCYGRGREIFWRVGLKGNAAKAYGKDKLGICVLFAESDHEGVISSEFGKLFSYYPEEYLYYLSSNEMFISVTPDYFNILGYRHYY